MASVEFIDADFPEQKQVQHASLCVLKPAFPYIKTITNRDDLTVCRQPLMSHREWPARLFNNMAVKQVSLFPALEHFMQAKVI